MQYLARDLQALLAAPDAGFWAAATSNASLAACLDGYLQNSRWAGLKCVTLSVWNRMPQVLSAAAGQRRTYRQQPVAPDSSTHVCR